MHLGPGRLHAVPIGCGSSNSSRLDTVWRQTQRLHNPDCRQNGRSCQCGPYGWRHLGRWRIRQTVHHPETGSSCYHHDAQKRQRVRQRPCCRTLPESSNLQSCEASCFLARSGNYLSRLGFFLMSYGGSLDTLSTEISMPVACGSTTCTVRPDLSGATPSDRSASASA